MSDGRIAVILPSRESFTLRKSGALALCARDFGRFSRFAGRIDVFGTGPCEYEDVSYRRLEGWRRWWRRNRSAYLDAVANAVAGYGLIEVGNRPYMMAPLRRRFGAAKLVLHLQNDPQGIDKSRSAEERAKLLEVCDAVNCVSDFISARFLDGVADPEGKVVTIYNGVALAEPGVRKEKIVAFTGRVIAEKGVSELVRAFAALPPTDWRLVIAGGDPDGLLTRLGAERAALGDRFAWLGQVSHAQVSALLDKAEIAAVPSTWDEPFGRAAIEAMAAGAALVTSRRGALPEVCGQSAVYVEPADTAGFAAALRRLTEDDAFRGAVQAAGRARVAARFEISQATARLDAVRARCLGEAG